MSDEEQIAPSEDLLVRTYPRYGESLGTHYVGLPRDTWRDAYHVLLTLSWPRFIGLIATVYLLLNTLFALLYNADPYGVLNARRGDFADHFFFSVQTLGGLGYGVMAPRDLYSNLVMTLETVVGLFNLAIATGLMFARFSRPTARIMFSEIAVVAPFEGTPSLMFRAANRRNNLVMEAEVTVNLVRNITTAEGVVMRRFQDLPVVRARTPMFVLTWQVIHPIGATSPLFGETAQSLLAQQAEIVVVMRGTDETFASTIHARASYTPDQIRWGRQLADIFSFGPDGRRVIDFTHFHDAA